MGDYQFMGGMRYILTASNKDETEKKRRVVKGLNDVPRWANDVEKWPNLLIETPAGKIKYQRKDGVVVVDNTRVNLSKQQ
jgi:hypothetical protein